MTQNSGLFLMSSHGHPSFNPRLPSSMSSTSKRPGNGPMSMNSLPNTSIGPNINIPPSSSSSPSMRPSSSMGPLKPNPVGMNPLDKSNSTPYSARYTRKAWPMSRNIHDKNIRGHDEHEGGYLRSTLASSDNMSGSSFTIEPAADDDDNDDIYFSTRHIAAARFQRNQRLISEIFNEVCIPDFRTNVSVDRILTLRRQVQALKTHRETFEKDLKDLEEKHVEKKRKFLEANDKFYSEYAEASSKNLSQEKIDEILHKYEAMEKLQKEKQLLLQQQQQQAMAPPPPPPPAVVQPQAAPSTTETVLESSTPVVTKSEPTPAAEGPQEESPVSTPPPPPPPPPPQAAQAPLSASQAAQASLSTSQAAQAPLPASQPASVPQPTSQSTPSHLPPSQPVSTPLPPVQAVQSQMLPSQSIQTQLPPLQPPVMQHMPHPQQQQQQQQQHLQQSNIPPQGYPMMHSGANPYVPQSAYGYPQQTSYRQPMTQRPVQYPTNPQWQQQQPQQQQQQQQQQWQTSSYDPRYYNQYPSNVQWATQQQQPQLPPQQQQQQWAPNSAQQQMGVVSSHQQAPQMRVPPQSHQQAQMYGANVHYGYGNTNVGWNPATHPSQQYAYPQNPAYDPSMMSAPPQQQHYVQAQMHNPPQGYDYGPPQPQQQQIPSQQSLPPMN